jgi:hypothetical protein
MSDSQKLKDCVAEYHKATKRLEDRLNKIAECSRQIRQGQEGQSSHQS